MPLLLSFVALYVLGVVGVAFAVVRLVARRLPRLRVTEGSWGT